MDRATQSTDDIESILREAEGLSRLAVEDDHTTLCAVSLWSINYYYGKRTLISLQNHHTGEILSEEQRVLISLVGHRCVSERVSEGDRPIVRAAARRRRPSSLIWASIHLRMRSLQSNISLEQLAYLKYQIKI